jgi:hypothetical protein
MANSRAVELENSAHGVFYILTRPGEACLSYLSGEILHVGPGHSPGSTHSFELTMAYVAGGRLYLQLFLNKGS